MALDTQEKRMNAVGVGRPWMGHPFPVGATDEQSRIARGLGFGNTLSPGGASQTITVTSSIVSGEVFGTPTVSGGLLLGDYYPKHRDIWFLTEGLPRYGNPGTLVILPRDGENPQFWMWDQKRDEWRFIL